MKKFQAVALVVFALALVFFVAGPAIAQVSPTGTLVGTVTDPSGAIVPGATVTATGATTGTTVTATSGADGRFVIASMAPGEYNVTVTKDGFKTGVFTAVKITVGLTYELKAKLEIGGASTTVTVESGAQVLHTATASISSTVQGPEITQLPFTSRNASDLAILDPGAQTAGNPRNTSFNGLPKGSINITEDGINTQDNLLKSSDGFFAIISPRVDDISEFSISTAANSASQTGEGAIQISMVSQQGSNQFHGGAWEYFRNTYLNANYYFTNLAGSPRQIIKSNQFGFKIGGPILKNKLFFFGDLDMYRFPHSVARNPIVPTTQTANGIMAYNATSPQAANPNAWTTCAGTSCTANLLAMATATGHNATPDSLSQSLFAAMASAATAPGVTSQGGSAPYLSVLTFQNSGIDHRNFPDIRFDYDISKNHSIEFAYHYDHFTSNPDFLNGFDATLPVAPFSAGVGGQISNRNLFVGAWRWTIGSNKSNELRFGIQSAPVSFFPNLSLSPYPSASTNLGNIHIRPRFANGNSAIVTEPFHSFATQGRNTALGQLIENFGWNKGSHFLSFGMTGTDLRFNDFFASALVANVNLGVDTSDPAATMFTGGNLPGMSAADINAAEQIYANVVGDVSGYSASLNLNHSTRQFQSGLPRLDKVSQLEMGFYASDSWQVRPGFTFNYGLRWEYEGIPNDLLNQYFNLAGGYSAAFGVSGLNNLFKPGTLTGTTPSFVLNGSKTWYNKYYKSFAPTVGLAWQPGFENNLYRKVFGTAGQTVFRAGYSISFDRNGLNNFQSLAPGNGGFSGSQAMNPGTVNGPGEFVAGSVALHSLSFQNVAQTPAAFSTSFAIQPANNPGGVNVYNPNLHAPYVQSWSAGIQRQIGSNMALEVRYVGNHGVGLWEQADLNETNIFENGFLTEFKNAASNLAVCQATSGCNTGFADAGLAGQVSLPILQAAFTGSQAVSTSSKFFTNGIFERDLTLGLAGSFANSLAKNSTLTFICNMAGTNAFPGVLCPGTATPAGAGFPKNFFLTNPDATGGAFVIYNGAQSTYNAMQVVFRRRLSSGLQFDAGYTFSHSLTNQYASSSASFYQFRTLRNPSLDKGPAPFDLRHSFKMESLWSLPFGPGHRLSTGNSFVNRLIGGWSLNTINRWQTGRVDLLTGGLGGTFNGNDGGVNIVGMSMSQLQGQLHLIKTPDSFNSKTGLNNAPGEVFYFPANLLTTPLVKGGGAANPAVLQACSTPGTFCGRPFIYGPSFFRADWSLVKDTKITEKTSFELRLNALNVFNNQNFYYGGPAVTASSIATTTPITSTSFGRIFSAFQDSGSDDPGGRILELVGRFTF